MCTVYALCFSFFSLKGQEVCKFLYTNHGRRVGKTNSNPSISLTLQVDIKIPRIARVGTNSNKDITFWWCTVGRVLKGQPIVLSSCGLREIINLTSTSSNDIQATHWKCETIWWRHVSGSSCGCVFSCSGWSSCLRWEWLIISFRRLGSSLAWRNSDSS